MPVRAKKTRPHITSLVQRTIPPAGRLGSREGTTLGKFFLFVVALSVAILLAMSVYIISL
jgi:hypothetical protein